MSRAQELLKRSEKAVEGQSKGDKGEPDVKPAKPSADLSGKEATMAVKSSAKGATPKTKGDAKEPKEIVAQAVTAGAVKGDPESLDEETEEAKASAPDNKDAKETAPKDNADTAKSADNAAADVKTVANTADEVKAVGEEGEVQEGAAPGTQKAEGEEEAEVAAAAAQKELASGEGSEGGGGGGAGGEGGEEGAGEGGGEGGDASEGGDEAAAGSEGAGNVEVDTGGGDTQPEPVDAGPPPALGGPEVMPQSDLVMASPPTNDFSEMADSMGGGPATPFPVVAQGPPMAVSQDLLALSGMQASSWLSVNFPKGDEAKNLDSFAADNSSFAKAASGLKSYAVDEVEPLGLDPFKPQPYTMGQGDGWDTVQAVLGKVGSVAGTIADIAGMIGTILTVAGWILSILLPPVGIAIQAIARVCNIVEIVANVVAAVCTATNAVIDVVRLCTADTPQQKLKFAGRFADNVLATGGRAAVALMSKAGLKKGAKGAGPGKVFAKVFKSSGGGVKGFQKGLKFAAVSTGRKIGKGIKGFGAKMKNAGGSIKNAFKSVKDWRKAKVAASAAKGSKLKSLGSKVKSGKGKGVKIGRQNKGNRKLGQKLKKAAKNRRETQALQAAAANRRQLRQIAATKAAAPGIGARVKSGIGKVGTGVKTRAKNAWEWAKESSELGGIGKRMKESGHVVGGLKAGYKQGGILGATKGGLKGAWKNALKVDPIADIAERAKYWMGVGRTAVGGAKTIPGKIAAGAGVAIIGVFRGLRKARASTMPHWDTASDAGAYIQAMIDGANRKGGGLGHALDEGADSYRHDLNLDDGEETNYLAGPWGDPTAGTPLSGGGNVHKDRVLLWQAIKGKGRHDMAKGMAQYLLRDLEGGSTRTLNMVQQQTMHGMAGPGTGAQDALGHLPDQSTAPAVTSETQTPTVPVQAPSASVGSATVAGLTSQLAVYEAQLNELNVLQAHYEAAQGRKAALDAVPLPDSAMASQEAIGKLDSEIALMTTAASDAAEAKIVFEKGLAAQTQRGSNADALLADAREKRAAVEQQMLENEEERKKNTEGTAALNKSKQDNEKSTAETEKGAQAGKEGEGTMNSTKPDQPKEENVPWYKKLWRATVGRALAAIAKKWAEAKAYLTKMLMKFILTATGNSDIAEKLEQADQKAKENQGATEETDGTLTEARTEIDKQDELADAAKTDAQRQAETYAELIVEAEETEKLANTRKEEAVKWKAQMVAYVAEFEAAYGMTFAEATKASGETFGQQDYSASIAGLQAEMARLGTECTAATGETGDAVGAESTESKEPTPVQQNQGALQAPTQEEQESPMTVDELATAIDPHLEDILGFEGAPEEEKEESNATVPMSVPTAPLSASPAPDESKTQETAPDQSAKLAEIAQVVASLQSSIAPERQHIVDCIGEWNAAVAAKWPGVELDAISNMAIGHFDKKAAQNLSVLQDISSALAGQSVDVAQLRLGVQAVAESLDTIAQNVLDAVYRAYIGAMEGQSAGPTGGSEQEVAPTPAPAQ